MSNHTAPLLRCVFDKHVQTVWERTYSRCWIYDTHRLTTISNVQRHINTKRVIQCQNRYNNDCNIIPSRYSLRTALCESIRYQTCKSEQNVRQDLIPRLRHGEAALMHNTRNSMPSVLPSQISCASTELKLTPNKSPATGKGWASDRPSSDKEHREWNTFIQF